MHRMLQYLAQALTYAGFALFVGYFSFWPRYQYAASDVAIVKVSLSHASDRVNPCVLLTPAEIAQLAPNMRRAEKCERKRLPLTLELDVDGAATIRLQASPSGVWDDGPTSMYQLFELRPGSHRISARLRDSGRTAGWDYEHSEEVVAQAGRYLTITFRAENGGFKIR